MKKKFAITRSHVWEACLLALVGLLLSYTWMYGEISVPNERSRVYLAVAIVDHGTFAIDEPIRQWGKIHDLAEKDGHYFSDKAPGSSFIGAAVYAVASQFKPAQEWRIRDLINLMRSWLMIPLSLLGFFVLRRLLADVGIDRVVIDIVSLAWIAGTAAFHYGAAYFGHQIVAVALLVSLWCLLRAEVEGDRTRLIRWSVGAGAAAGLAGLTEYQAIVPCALIAAYAAFGDKALRTYGLPALLLGAAPFAAMLLWYNDAAFGGPFELSYHYLADEKMREIHGQGIAGVSVPTWEYFSGSMFSMHRGLIATSPLFLFAIWGLWEMWDEEGRRLAAILLGTMVYFIAFVSSSNMWFAGWGFGPRLLVPAMALWSIPVAYGVQAALAHPVSEGLARGFAAVQIGIYQLMNVYFPEPPDSTTNPLVDVVGVMRANDLVSPNLGQKLGLSAPDSVTLALVLAAGAIGIVVVRGLRARERVARGMVLGGLCFSVLIAATVVSAVGPTWKDEQGARWVKLVGSWKSRE